MNLKIKIFKANKNNHLLRLIIHLNKLKNQLQYNNKEMKKKVSNKMVFLIF